MRKWKNIYKKLMDKSFILINQWCIDSHHKKKERTNIFYLFFVVKLDNI